jgi:chemotaxis protein methyltransferase CheR
MAGFDDMALAEIETELFVEALYRQRGIDFRAYRKPELHQALWAFCARSGVATISQLQGQVLRDGALGREVGRLLSTGASEQLALPSSFMALRCAVLPVLRAASWPNVWFAESADDGLVMQFVVMLEEEGLLAKTQLFVTNANEDLLGDVGRLRVPAAAMAARDARHSKGGGREPLGAYLDQDGDGFTLKPALREHIVWSQYDLASDATFKEFDLIICQRPLSGFELPLQQRALALFRQSLCNFGILQIDAPDAALAGDLARDFVCLLTDQGIYRRLP